VAISCIDDMVTKDTSLTQQFDWNSLKRASRADLAPFQIALQDHKDTLFCDEMLRVMPGRRLVASGRWGSREVVAKLFYERSNALRHAARDARGIKALLAAGVQTPLLFHEGVSEDRRIQILIFEKIDGHSLDVIWQDTQDQPETQALMHAVTIEMATHHVLGILQNDLHFKNFIVSGKKIFTIDGGDVEIFDSPLGKKASLENLALFFSQLGIGQEKLQQSLFQTYAKSRGWMIKPYDVTALETFLNKCTTRRLEQYSKKIMRSCSAFARSDSSKAVTIYDRKVESAEFLACLNNIEQIIASPLATVLKAGRSATVVKVTLADKPYIIKRYNIKSVFHWLRRSLRMSRAMSGWCLAQRLLLLGVATARPVAVIEKRFFGLRGKSYLIMEYVKGEHSGEYFAGTMRDTDWAAATAGKIISLFENLAKLLITHGDLKMTNILFEKHRPVLIDLDGMREHQTFLGFRLAFHKEIKRFMKNWRERPTIYALFEHQVRAMYKRLNMQW
jgi:tRNA A-37 threonylcarbamoyl transferase component Bud32